MTAIGNQIGKHLDRLLSASTTIAVITKPLSAIGSKIAPRRLRWLKRRAINPSKPSMAAARMNTNAAITRTYSAGRPRLTLTPYPHAKIPNIGIRQRRAIVILFANVIQMDIAETSLGGSTPGE